MSSSAVSASAKGVTFLILLQVGSRGFTFIVNQILLRYLSPELLGLSAQLELFSITVLYFARESIRVAVQRQPDQTQKVVNFAYVSTITGVPLTYGLAYLFLRAETPDVPFFTESLWIYGGSCIVELLSEPAFVAAQQQLLYKVRALTETFATITRCLVTCAAAVWASKGSMDIGVLPFALGQLGYASILLKLYWLQMWPLGRQLNFSLLPLKLGKVENEDRPILGYFSRNLSNLSLSLFLQNSFKYVLTQGDGLLIAALASLRDQGTYALASNYGGLIARMLFQPIEETSRNLFAKICAPGGTSEAPSKKSIVQARILLEDILKLYGLIALVAIAVGPSAAPLLLRIVAGNKWADTEASEVLATYCYYIPLLAVNGVTEAFVAAVASSRELHTQSIFMGVFFAGFAGAAYVLLYVLQLGAQGLVYSNCVNMGFRIVFNFWFIKSYFTRQGEAFRLSTALPNSLSIAVAVAIGGILRAPLGLVPVEGFLGELVQVGALSAVLGTSLLLFERNYLKHCYQLLSPSTTPHKSVSKQQQYSRTGRGKQ